MTNPISYTENNQDTLSQEQTNVTQETVSEQLEQQDIPNSGSEQTTNESSNVDFIGMSDEEFLNSNVDITAANQEPVQQQPVETKEQIVSEETNADDTNNAVNEQVTNTINPEEFMSKVTSEFTANGRKVRIDNPDDIVRLMQMGLNYNKKMEVLKPNLAIVKTLQQHNVTNEDLQFLLDLKNHDKTAIAKLLKEANVDTYELPDLEQEQYIPKSQLISEQEATFQDTLAEIRNNPQGHELLVSLGTEQWDDTSLQFFQNSPEALNLLYEDKRSGLYDNVLQTIDMDKALGRIPPQWLNKPFIELYEFVASNLSQQQQNAQQVNTQQPIAPKAQPQVIGHNLKAPVVQQQNTAPKSASVTSGTTVTPNVLADVPDFMSMTDTQFEAFMNSAQGVKFN